MIIVALHGITKGYPLGDVLCGIDWEIKSGEKIAMLGRNGTGKTTLMGIVSARLHQDDGTRTVGRGARIAELSQIPDRDTDISLYNYLVTARGDLQALEKGVAELAELVAQSPHNTDLQERLGTAQAELENAGGYELEHQVEMVLTGLGFSTAQWKQALASFSGGERTRAELGRLLLTPADLWLLDEPTNHLDIAAVEWLEGFLADSPVACVLVSHDRVLLERFAGQVIEIIDGRLEIYDGDYRYYRKEKIRRQEQRQKAYELQRTEIKRIEDFIVRNIAGQKTKQAQSRRRALGKLERLDAPQLHSRAMKLGFETQRTSYREVLIIDGLTRSFGNRKVLDELALVCERGDKIGVIGANGTGKSTLLQAIVGLDNDYQGEIRIGERVELGYFDQHLDILSGHGSVIAEIWDEHPQFDAGELRSYLARFLFRGDDVFKAVSALSGGEKSRLALAKLMLTKANFLVLDEPTNHLDITAREVLEDALADFEGTALVVSHDRRFLDRFSTKILELKQGSATLSLGNYTDWAYRRKQVAATEDNRTAARSSEPSAAAAAWKASKAERARVQKIERQRRKFQEQIATAEHSLQAIESKLADESLAHDWEQLAVLTDERDKLYNSLSDLYQDIEDLPDTPD